ncbi:hypothetical protein BT67DRAFT_377897 [Trichocladium antarcticum]|uniref:Calponin-homology (CH) domain-containing protein n=1 Tax=Trichocladium antarcticum TaxID=1450529 RepID=A0AAN6ZF32_9PEZI|nr:hypothetical protein BT67DRAFT_377897 [Trichocladium antarcticum]
MASVSSLDKDLRRLRLERYTPAAANEAKVWIESVLGTRLPRDDLLEGLKDGVALCKLVNLAVGPPGVRFKQSAMPFVQMENISHFLRACQAPPLNLQQHDMFLTVDLFEQKDPAQVLQCIGAFSRAANSIKPAVFPVSIGGRSSRAGVSPQPTGSASPGLRGRGLSNASNTSSGIYGRGSAMVPSRTGDSGSGRWSPTKSPARGATSSPSPPVSSWSKKEHEGATSPAWNISQYGYMGGASQGNLGIAFGGRRQITTAGPFVPNLVEKERRRKEKEADAERLRQGEELRRRAETEAEEERVRVEEGRRWEEETRRAREEEKRSIEEEKRRWAEEERQWKLTEEKRRREEEAAEARLEEERRNVRKSNPQLRGQFLSQYQDEQESADKARIRQLEKQLELARQREAAYERGRQVRGLRPVGGNDDKKARSRSRSRPPPTSPGVARQDSWSVRDEQDFLSTQWSQHQKQQQLGQLDEGDLESPLPPTSPRPLPDPTAALKPHRAGGDAPPALPVRTQHTGSRPLPDPTAYTANPPGTARSWALPQSASAPLPHLPPRQPTPNNMATPSRLHSPAAIQPAPKPFPAYPPARAFPAAAAAAPPPPPPPPSQQPQTKPTGPPRSLLEREMELERQRQREWEDAQRETATRAVRPADGDGGGGVEGIGGGVGGRWDVSQWTGYTGGDSQNRGALGIGAGRRQIVGGLPRSRPLPEPPR